MPTLKEAVNLINRQQAEIERLKEYPKCVYEYDGDIVDYCLKSPCVNYKTAEKIKSEAYKEFAERLKEKLDICVCGYSSEEVTNDVEDTIDNLLKEMGGENNGLYCTE